MGRTWAPSPLSFPACDNDDGFEEGEIIDIAMPIRIPTRRPLVGPRSPLSAVRYVRWLGGGPYRPERSLSGDGRPEELVD